MAVVRAGSVDEPVAIDAQYRDFMSGFPSGVAVITAMAGGRVPKGLTCTSLTSVTLDPPTLLVCLGERTGTLAALRETGLFGVNLLNAQARRAAEIFGRSGADRFGQVPWHDSTEFGLPCLHEDAMAFAQCAVTTTRQVGDHVVVFGEVRRVRALSTGAPLLYGRRRFTAWTAPGETGPGTVEADVPSRSGRA